jgi:hypothetical protein
VFAIILFIDPLFIANEVQHKKMIQLDREYATIAKIWKF